MLVTALAPKIGYDNAAKIAKHSVANSITVRQATIDLGYVDGEKLTDRELMSFLFLMVIEERGLVFPASATPKLATARTEGETIASAAAIPNTVAFPRGNVCSIGITAATTQEIWKDHPEKVLGTTGEFVKKYPNTARAVTAAIIEAGKWIDASLSNKLKMAETVADKSYVNTSVDVINQRILGRYQNGLGKTWDDPNHMKFYNDGGVTYPYLSDGMWFLTQHKRWGLLKEHPDYLAVAKAVNRIDIYKQAAAATNTPLPKSEMRSTKMLDGTVWDGKDPKKYADSFKIHA